VRLDRTADEGESLVGQRGLLDVRVGHAGLDGHAAAGPGLDLEPGQATVEIAATTNLEPAPLPASGTVVAAQVRSVEVDGSIGERTVPVDLECQRGGGQAL